jgi:hypothetical protein
MMMAIVWIAKVIVSVVMASGVMDFEGSVKGESG